MDRPDQSQEELEVSPDAWFIGTAIRELAGAIRKLAETQEITEVDAEESPPVYDMAGNKIA